MRYSAGIELILDLDENNAWIKATDVGYWYNKVLYHRVLFCSVWLFETVNEVLINKILFRLFSLLLLLVFYFRRWRVWILWD